MKSLQLSKPESQLDSGYETGVAKTHNISEKQRNDLESGGHTMWMDTTRGSIDDRDSYNVRNA